MNPFLSPYTTLTQVVQEVQVFNGRLFDSLILARIRNLLHLFLEKIASFLNQDQLSLLKENDSLKEELQLLNQDLKEKINILKILEEEFLATQFNGKSLQVAVHEIKTPLTSVLGFAELLMGQRQGLNEGQLELLQRLYQNAKKQLDIIDSMLDNDVRQSLVAQCKDVELHVLLDQLSANASLQAKKKNLHFYALIDDDIPLILFTDEIKLQSLLSNLLSNAVKYTDEGEVRFEVTLNESSALLFQVSDSGRGIALQDQESIFRFFERGSNTQKVPGIGVGLALCKEIANVLGGNLHLSSPGIHQGSTFTLRLPIQVKQKLPPLLAKLLK